MHAADQSSMPTPHIVPKPSQELSLSTSSVAQKPKIIKEEGGVGSEQRGCLPNIFLDPW